MADNNIRQNLKDFIRRIKGSNRLRTSNGQKGGASILDEPIEQSERKRLTKLQSVIQYVRQRTWARQYTEFFDEYRRMSNTFPIIKAALDIYAEEATARDTSGNVLRVNTDNKKVREELEKFFFQYININARSFSIVRGMVQFGNQYIYHVFRKGAGIIDIVFLPPEEIQREDMFDYNDLSRHRFSWYGSSSDFYDSIELSHFRNVEDVEMLPYGSSILRPVIDTWRRIILMREALIIHRITRAPNRFLFKIATDGLTGDEALKYTNELKKEITKKPMVDPQTGEIDFSYNTLSIEDNIFLPTFEGSSSDVSVLEGSSNLDSIEDYKIIKDDLFAGLKIPKSWLSFEEDLSNKSALGEEDIRFAKTIQRIQADFLDELMNMALVHLAYLGFSEEEMESFTLECNNPSSASETKKLELLEKRINLAKAAWDPSNEGALNLMSYTDVCKSILKLTDKEIEESIKKQFAEAHLMWRYKKIREEGFYQISEDQKKNEPTVGFKKSENTFDNLRFEAVDDFLSSNSLQDLVKKKIDEEINFLFPKVQKQATRERAQFINEGLKKSKKKKTTSLTENLKKVRNQLSN